MKNEKTMKLKKITFVSVIGAIAVASVTLFSVFFPKCAVVRAAADKDAKNPQVETIMQIEILEAEYQKSFDENAELWEKYFAGLQKLDELPDDFTEKEFIGGLTTLTDDEKTALLKSVEALDELDAKLNKLFDELFDKDEDVLYKDCEEGICDFAEKDDKYFADNGCGDYDMPFIENDENFFGENFGKACEEAERENDKIQELKKEFDELTEARRTLG